MKPVTIYTSSTCRYCHEAKAFFDRNGIRYTEINISNDVEARKDLMKRGYRTVPVIFIGNEVVVGFDEEEITEVLGL